MVLKKVSTDNEQRWGEWGSSKSTKYFLGYLQLYKGAVRQSADFIKSCNYGWIMMCLDGLGQCFKY